MAKSKNFTKNTAELFISAAPDPEPAQGEIDTADNRNAEIPKGYKLVKENKSERMQLLVRPVLKEAIKQEAMAQGVSMNDLVNGIFEEYMERKGRI